MRDQPIGPPQCFNCGEETADWDEIGYQKVWVCGKRACHREIAAANRAVDEEAQDRAAQDHWDRYR